MKIGRREFSFDGTHTFVMGILNVTPDSFSDGGKFDSTDRALKHVENMICQGADIIDVGGESTRPGYVHVPVEEEIERIVTVVEQIRENFDIPISVDTYKAPVMEEAFYAGADMANDIWGLRYESLSAREGFFSEDSLFENENNESIWPCGTMAQVVARHKKPVCIMQNRREMFYHRLIPDMLNDLQQSVAIGEAAGISRELMILDPGIGFGKTYEQNLEVLANLEEFQKLGFPLLLAASRKSVIGQTLELPTDQREEGTLVTTVLATLAHWDMVRVHDVEKNVRAIRMLEKIREFA